MVTLNILVFKKLLKVSAVELLSHNSGREAHVDATLFHLVWLHNWWLYSLVPKVQFWYAILDGVKTSYHKLRHGKDVLGHHGNKANLVLGHHGNKANLVLGTLILCLVPFLFPTRQKWGWLPSDARHWFFFTGNCISIPHKVNRRKLVGNDNC